MMLYCNYIQYLLFCMYIVDAWTSVHTVIWTLKRIFMGRNLENVFTVGIIYIFYPLRTICHFLEVSRCCRNKSPSWVLCAVKCDGALLLIDPSHPLFFFWLTVLLLTQVFYCLISLHQCSALTECVWMRVCVRVLKKGRSVNLCVCNMLQGFSTCLMLQFL